MILRKEKPEMDFEKYLTQQLDTHLLIQPEDIIKMCYQAAYGPRHLLSRLSAAEKYFDEEYADVEPASMPLYENISDDYCRVNLAPWKKAGLSGKWLFKMFAASIGETHRDEALLLKYLNAADSVVQKGSTDISPEHWQQVIRKYKADGMPAVHHSDLYRQANSPSYRVVSRRVMRLLPILEKVRERQDDKPVFVIAVDGRAASGKSTMAEQLKTILDGQVIHMDDFFLPGQLRTDDRFAVPGSNVHYERFAEEVLPNVRKAQSFSYRKFDCGVMDYAGTREVSEAYFRIVEGAYSCHPRFGSYADLTVFSDVDPDAQMERVIKRNGSKMAEKFRAEWIPMEEEYFVEYGIRESADIIV